MQKLAAVLIVSACLVCAVAEPRIKNVVYMMMENRAFDHMVGYLKQLNPEIRGLTGNETNPFNTSDPNSPVVQVSFADGYVDPDPDHSIAGTTEQIFGCESCFSNPPPMNGFVQQMQEANPGDGPQVMRCFNDTSVPIISTLAMEFALFDMWFCSVPGPTLPNRLFSLSGTSYGYGENDILQALVGWPQKSFFKNMEDHGISWKVYSEEVPSALLFNDTRNGPMVAKMRSILEFGTDAAAGTLPQFSFIDPIYFSVLDIPASDQHPSHNVLEGEKLMKSVYETLRASKQWNETLLIITYDEHGGFHDGMPTPLNGIPNPDGRNTTHTVPFNFTRQGVRIPTVMVSPWIKKGTVVHEGVGPTSTSNYDGTSMIATLEKMWGMPFLTKRDVWASTFENVFSDPTLKEPRTDCPTTLPPIPSELLHTVASAIAESEGPVSELQEDWISLASALIGIKTDGKNMFKTQGDAGIFVRKAMSQFRDQFNL